MAQQIFIITDNGDPSVGIPAKTSTVTVDSCVCDSPSAIKATKEALEDAFEKIHDFPVVVQTQDEFFKENESLEDNYSDCLACSEG